MTRHNREAHRPPGPVHLPVLRSSIRRGRGLSCRCHSARWSPIGSSRPTTLRQGPAPYRSVGGGRVVGEHLRPRGLAAAVGVSFASLDEGGVAATGACAGLAACASVLGAFSSALDVFAAALDVVCASALDVVDAPVDDASLGTDVADTSLEAVDEALDAAADALCAKLVAAERKELPSSSRFSTMRRASRGWS